VIYFFSSVGVRGPLHGGGSERWAGGLRTLGRGRGSSHGRYVPVTPSNQPINQSLECAFALRCVLACLLTASSTSLLASPWEVPQQTEDAGPKHTLRALHRTLPPPIILAPAGTWLYPPPLLPTTCGGSSAPWPGEQVSDFAEIEAHIATTVISAIQHVFVPDIRFPAVQADKVRLWGKLDGGGKACLAFRSCSSFTGRRARTT
jgi:hypothetical protein